MHSQKIYGSSFTPSDKSMIINRHQKVLNENHCEHRTVNKIQKITTVHIFHAKNKATELN